MKVVVIGGTGLIGSKLVDRLRAQGHEAVPAAPSTGVDTLTGEGLAEALQGASVVVDVSNSPSFADDDVMEFFRTSTTNLLKAEAEAGATHHVALSVVGTDRLQESGYFRAKLAQEDLIRASRTAYSIVHATQFFEFMKGIADAATDGDTVRAGVRDDRTGVVPGGEALADDLVQPERLRSGSSRSTPTTWPPPWAVRPWARPSTVWWRSPDRRRSGWTRSSARASPPGTTPVRSSRTPARGTGAPGCGRAPCFPGPTRTSPGPVSPTGSRRGSDVRGGGPGLRAGPSPSGHRR
jgi:hypothetical protein